MADKVAVVTGSNKGIGFGIVRELCRRGVGVVYLTARDSKRGKDAVEHLKKEGFNPVYYQLEVTDKDSVKKFAEHLKKTHGGLDILINNAGVITEDLNQTTYVDSENVINVNYRSILIIQEFLFPVLKDNARVINISSSAGHITNIKSEYWIDRLTKDNITVEDVNAFVNWFLDTVKDGSLNSDDFVEMPLLAYRISKVALCALTRVQQKNIGRDISINSLHPGFVQTNMTKGSGDLTMEEASKAPAYLALDVDQSIKGRYFWFDKSEKDWADRNLKIYLVFEYINKQLKAAGL